MPPLSPPGAPHKATISWLARESLGFAVQQAHNATTSPANAAYPSANLVYYIPFRLGGEYRPTKMFWAIGGAVAGNIDAGIYDVNGNLLTNTGSTAMSGSLNAYQNAALTTVLTLPAGPYYMAFMCSSTSASFRGRTVTGAFAPGFQAMGCVQQSLGSLGLLSSATFASFAQAFLPIFGMTRASAV